MKRNITFILATILLSNLACTKIDDGHHNIVDVSNDEVVLSTTILSKASGDSWSSGDEIGVFAVADDTSLGDNVQFITTAGDGQFSAASTKIYYPQTGSLTISAYYPYDNALVGSIYKIDMADQSTPEDIDLMVASATSAATKDAVALEFKHRLSFINVEMVRGDGITEAEFAQFTASVEGTMAVADYDILKDSVIFAESTVAQDIPLIKSNESGKVMARAMVIPQELSGARLKFSYVDVSNPSSPTAGHYYYVPKATEYERGKAYDYQIKISRSEVGSGTFIIDGWAVDSDSDNDDITATEVAWTLENINVGNYPQTSVWRVQCKATTQKSNYDNLKAAILHYGKDVKLHLFGNKSLPAEVFSGFSGRIVELTVHDATSIGSNACGNMTYLKVVEMPEVTNVSSSALISCPALLEAHFEAATMISDYAFKNCSRLTTIAIYDATYIGQEAFKDCTAFNTTLTPKSGSTELESNNVYFPEVNEVSSDAFVRCGSMAKLQFPKLRTIGERAFSECTGVSTISRTDIPIVTTIMTFAFSHCTSLSSVAFGDQPYTPSTALTMGSRVFHNCHSLKSIYAERAVDIGYRCFDISPVTGDIDAIMAAIGDRQFRISFATAAQNNETTFNIFKNPIYVPVDQVSFSTDMFGELATPDPRWGLTDGKSVVAGALALFPGTGITIDFDDDNITAGQDWILLDDADGIDIDKGDKSWKFKDGVFAVSYGAHFTSPNAIERIVAF